MWSRRDPGRSPLSHIPLSFVHHHTTNEPEWILKQPFISPMKLPKISAAAQVQKWSEIATHIKKIEFLSPEVDLTCLFRACLEPTEMRAEKRSDICCKEEKTLIAIVEFITERGGGIPTFSPPALFYCKTPANGRVLLPPSPSHTNLFLSSCRRERHRLHSST